MIDRYTYNWAYARFLNGSATNDLLPRYRCGVDFVPKTIIKRSRWDNLNLHEAVSDRLSAVNAKLNKWLLRFRLPQTVKFALFVLFTLISIVSTMALLPHLAVSGPWGYIAGFVINLLSAASVAVPGPGMPVTLLMATKLNPVWLGIAAGIGGTIGELTGYWLGAQGRAYFSGNRLYNMLSSLMNRIQQF